MVLDRLTFESAIVRFQEREVLGTKLFEIKASFLVSGPQPIKKIDHEVFQVHDSNPGSKWLKSTSPDDRL